jgi:hypothetical protein
MGQRIRTEGDGYVFSVHFLVHPDGRWTIDAMTKYGFDPYVITPLISGRADQSMTRAQENRLREMVFSLVEAGISRVVMPF